MTASPAPVPIEETIVAALHAAYMSGRATAASVCRVHLDWRMAEHGLIKSERIGVDASTTEANAALHSIVRRHSGEGIARCWYGWPRRAASQH
jgi:hypothetical protein